jgi:biopolymer transport protein TolQ
VTADLSLVHLVTGASFLVQIVLFLLLMVSIASWTLIFRKWRELKIARAALDEFEARFWSGTDLDALHKHITSRPEYITGAAGIFEAGFRTFLRLRQKEKLAPRELLEGVQRNMRIALNREVDNLEMHLPFLATVGSTSPYVGLFGTVWGIMNSFRALGNIHQATLALVAPGIAEALIATAMGLFAAIPAVISYNRYVNDVGRLINHYENFLEEFSSILQRQIHN